MTRLCRCVRCQIHASKYFPGNGSFEKSWKLSVIIAWNYFWNLNFHFSWNFHFILFNFSQAGRLFFGSITRDVYQWGTVRDLTTWLFNNRHDETSQEWSQMLAKMCLQTFLSAYWFLNYLLLLGTLYLSKLNKYQVEGLILWHS